MLLNNDVNTSHPGIILHNRCVVIRDPEISTLECGSDVEVWFRSIPEVLWKELHVENAVLPRLLMPESQSMT